MISVDGDMSTNDSVYAFAPPGERQRDAGVRARRCARVCRDLALAMVRDGEGATKTLTVNVTGAQRRSAGAHDRARDRQQLSGQDRAVRRRPELGPHHRRRRRGARRTRSGNVVAQARRQAVGRARRDRGALRSRSASRLEEQPSRSTLDLGIGDASPPPGAATSRPTTSASTRTTGRDRRWQSRGRGW